MNLWTKIAIVALVVIVTLGILAGLYINGFFANTKWETLAMIGAAAAGPYLYFRNWVKEKLFSSGGDRIRESEEMYVKLKKAEEEKRENMAKVIALKEEEIALLKREASMLNLELKNLQSQRSAVKSEVAKLSNQEVLKEFDEEF